jgi:hypothetical protein
LRCSPDAGGLIGAGGDRFRHSNESRQFNQQTMNRTTITAGWEQKEHTVCNPFFAVSRAI